MWNGHSDKGQLQELTPQPFSLKGLIRTSFTKSQKMFEPYFVQARGLNDSGQVESSQIYLHQTQMCKKNRAS